MESNGRPLGFRSEWLVPERILGAGTGGDGVERTERPFVTRKNGWTVLPGEDVREARRSTRRLGNINV